MTPHHQGFDPTKSWCRSRWGFDPESDGGFDPTESWVSIPPSPGVSIPMGFRSHRVRWGFRSHRVLGFRSHQVLGCRSRWFRVSNPTHGFRSLGFEPDSWVSIPMGFEPDWWVSIPMGFEPDSWVSIPRVRTRPLGIDP